MPQGARCRASPFGSARRDGGCQLPARCPLIAFLRFQRAALFRDRDALSARGRSHARALLGAGRPLGTRPIVRPFPALPRTVRVCFTPATLLSFRLQGLDPPGDADASPRPVLPCRWPAHSDADLGFEGFTPPDSRPARRYATHAPCPPGVHPFEAFTPAAVEPASRILLSRASPCPGQGRRRAAPQSLNEQRARFHSNAPQGPAGGTCPSEVPHLVTLPNRSRTRSEDPRATGRATTPPTGAPPTRR